MPKERRWPVTVFGNRRVLLLANWLESDTLRWKRTVDRVEICAPLDTSLGVTAKDGPNLQCWRGYVEI